MVKLLGKGHMPPLALFLHLATFPRTWCKHIFLEIFNKILVQTFLDLQLTLFDSEDNNRKIKCYVAYVSEVKSKKQEKASFNFTVILILKKEQENCSFSFFCDYTFSKRNRKKRLLAPVQHVFC